MLSTEQMEEILFEFLSTPLTDANNIFERFEALPDAIFAKGENPLERYVCIPGKRKEGLVLVAHTDTVWDAAYDNPQETEIVFEEGIFKGKNENCGIGADDRAGCAMLWALRNSGHTLLLLNGEERGKLGAKFLKKSNPSLFRFINKHRFIIEFDWMSTGGCLYNQVDNTKQFKNYITENLKFKEDKNPGGCDLQILCRKICGVNLGTGYHKHHTTKEYLSLDEWANTYRSVSSFLEKNHPRFPVSKTKPILRFIRRVLGKIYRTLKSLFKIS